MFFIRTLIALISTSLLLCAICSAQIIPSKKLDAQLVSRDSYSQVVPAGSSRQIAFTADPKPTGGDIFHVVSSIPNATVSLILPNATEITSANAAALGFSFDTFQNDDTTAGDTPSPISSLGTHTLISIPPSSAAGSYSVKVVAPAGPEPTVVIASYLSSSEVHAGLVTDSQWYRVGETVVLSALVFNDQTAVTNAAVTAALDDSFEDTTPPATVTLQDSGAHDLATGDGIYTGTFTPTRAGLYNAAVRVTGTAAGVSFKRLAGTSFRVQEPLASFVSFSNAGVDDNADGLFDRIVVSSNVSVQRAGRYQFSLSLVASNGAIVKSESFADLLTGSAQVSVQFSAATILELGVNGPYRIKDAMLTFYSDPSLLVADYRADVGDTAAYTLTSLNRPALFFTANKTAVGIDTNGNGKYDVLRVRAEVLALQAGLYEWSAVLADPAGNEIQFLGSAGHFVAGSNFITLDFSGSAIGQHAVNGPYTVKSVILFGQDQSIIVDRLLDTQAFSYKEFENSDNLRLGTVTTTETSGDGDTFIEPGENGSLSVQLTNVGATTITGINATLSTSTPGVTITSAQSTYPSLAASATAVNATAFAFTLSSEVPCAETIEFKLTINHVGDGGIPSVVHFSIQSGRPTSSSTFSYTGAAVAIPDNQVAGVNIPLNVSGLTGSIKDLNFRFDGSACSATAGSTTVGLDHTLVGDLVATLTSPSGTSVRLLIRPGGGAVPSFGNNFCNTVLDDEGGTTSIQNISASGNPYSGTFIPAESLAAFRGENPNGTWTLNVADMKAADAGNVRAFSLVISQAECAVDQSQKILFRTDRHGAFKYEIYTMNEDGSNPTRLTTTTTNSGNYQPKWSPNGQKVAFAAEQDGTSWWDIIVMNVDGTNRINLTQHNAFESYFAFSPDGSKIVFESHRDGPFALWRINTDGTGLTKLINNGGPEQTPAWSPNGQKIAFPSYVNSVNNKTDIWVMNQDGSNPINLTQSADQESWPVWSPDGTKILFARRASSSSPYDIWVINADGSGLQRLTTNSTSAAFDWSPDGTKIAFQSNRDGNLEIYVMNANGTNQTRLTTHSSSDFQPKWSKDGSRILFSSFRTGNSEVFIMNANGTGQTNLTNNAAIDDSAQWRP